MFFRNRLQRAAGSAVFVVLGGFGIAIAQDAAPGDLQNTEADAELDVQRSASLSPDEQIQQSDRVIARGEQTSQRISGMLEDARRDRDIMRITCLSDRLTQVNTNLTSARSRSESLREAINGSDVDRRNHEFTVISVLSMKFRTLEQEANQCVGQDIFETGTTRIETSIDPAAPDEDPNVVDQPGEIDVPAIPPPASPTS
jgi:hypothetical protein